MSINKYLLIILFSFFTGLIFVVCLRRISLRYKILISRGIPLIGGISVGLSFILSCLFTFFLYRNLPSEIKVLLFASGIILLFGVIDDFREFPILTKITAQIIATSFLVSFGVRTHIVNIGNLTNIIITFVWMLGITNAFNHLDVIDGLAGGTAIIISSTFFVISILNGDFNTAILSLALAGAVFGFFLYNFPPAKVYLGNSGSHFLGFVLGTIALIISYAPLERKIALLTPLLILGLPIFDTAFVILMRIGKKKSPFRKSNDHLALRFLALGYSKKKALLKMLSLCLFFSFCAVLVSKATNTLGIGVIVIAILVSLIVTL